MTEVVSNGNYLQVVEVVKAVKDIVLPIVTTLTGAFVAYIIAKKNNENQKKLSDQKRDLEKLERIYYLLQEQHKQFVLCFSIYENFTRNSMVTVDSLVGDIVRNMGDIEIREVDRLLALNFKDLSVEYVKQRDKRLVFFAAILSGKREGLTENLAKVLAELVDNINLILDKVETRSEEIRSLK